MLMQRADWACMQSLDFVMLTHGIDLEEDFVHAEARSEGLSVDAVRLIRRVVALKGHAQASVPAQCKHCNREGLGCAWLPAHVLSLCTFSQVSMA